MPKTFKGKIALDIRDSTPDWEPYLAPRAREGAPNVLVLAWDDVGYGTMDVFGGPVETPNMRRIADRGVKFANFHTTALCSPTRASLLTGRNATSNGMATIAEFSSGFPGISTRIPFENGFMSEVLAEHGYNTYCVGQVAPDAGGGVQPRGVQGPVAARARVRTLLRMARRRDEQLVSRPRPRQPPDRPAGPTRGRLSRRRRPLGQGDRVHPRREGHRARQAVLHVLRAAGRPRAAPGAAGVGRQVQGHVRPGLRGDPRRHPGSSDRDGAACPKAPSSRRSTRTASPNAPAPTASRGPRSTRYGRGTR